ncbi:hypothetical protein RJ639_018579, partial [Escallonia herrerae]
MRHNQYQLYGHCSRRLVWTSTKSIRQGSVVNKPASEQEIEDSAHARLFFLDDDMGDVRTPYDDQLVIIIKVRNFDVKRVLVNNGTSTEIMFYDTFKEMNILRDHLQKMDTPLYGFSNHLVTVEGVITLPTAVGTPLMQANLMLDFVAVRIAYVLIIPKPIMEEAADEATVSVCKRCVYVKGGIKNGVVDEESQGGNDDGIDSDGDYDEEEDEDDDGGEFDVDDEEDDGENQVVTWSSTTPPPPPLAKVRQAVRSHRVGSIMLAMMMFRRSECMKMLHIFPL